MKIFIFLSFCVLFALILFGVFWILDAPIGSDGIRTREWWSNRPKFNDPECYERFKQDKFNKIRR